MQAAVIIGIMSVSVALAVGAALGIYWCGRRSTPGMPLREAATGLPNRAAALDQLTRALSLAERRGLAVTVLFIALDAAAQQRRADLARSEHALVQRLVPRLRTHELLAHWGAGQLLVVLPDADIASALVLASDLRQLAAAPSSDADANAAPLSISIGLHSRRPQPEQDVRGLAAEMVIAAQRALEVTAANGPGRIEIEP